jgi:hypothetical protein
MLVGNVRSLRLLSTMNEILRSLRVGGCSYASRLRGSSLTVQLWGMEPSGNGELIQCGFMRINGSFRGNWSAHVEIGREAFQFSGLSKKAVVESVSGIKCALSIKTSILRAPEIDINLQGENWKARFPKVLMLDGERTKDKGVQISGKSKSCKLCIFPAETYGWSSVSGKPILLPSTRPILHDASKELADCSTEVIKLLIAVSLSGFGFFF